MTAGGTRSPAGGEAGRGLIGFLVALAVVGFAGYCALQYLEIKWRADKLDSYALEALQEAARRKLGDDQVRAMVFKRAKELGVPIERASEIEVASDEAGWRIRFAWEETLVLPGYSTRLRYSVNHTWKRF